jgi:predicted RNA-binding protein with PUA-like domain
VALQTEPSDYSFERLLKDKKTTWTGVKNALALRHLRQVRKGDEIAIYHTGSVKAVVGIARATADAKEDAVELAPVKPVPPVTARHHQGRRALQGLPAGHDRPPLGHARAGLPLESAYGSA